MRTTTGNIVLAMGLWMAFSVAGRAQTVTELPDSLLLETPALSVPELELSFDRPSALSPLTVRLPGLEPGVRLNEEGVRIVPENLKLDYPVDSPYWHRSRNAMVGPYRNSYRNPIEGGDIVGIGAAYQVSDRFSIGGRAYMSSAYFGPVQPMRLTNGSLQLNAGYWVTDWLMVYGHGQASAARGLNPAYMSTIGGANYYGGGVQVKITVKFGFGVGVTRSYWMGDWTTSYQYYPVIY